MPLNVTCNVLGLGQDGGDGGGERQEGPVRARIERVRLA